MSVEEQNVERDKYKFLLKCFVCRLSAHKSVSVIETNGVTKLQKTLHHYYKEKKPFIKFIALYVTFV